MTKKTITFDIETTSLDSYKGRITCIGAKTNNNQKFILSHQNEEKLLSEFFIWLNKLSPNEYILLSHNGKGFDIPFIIARYNLLFEGSIEKHLFLYEHFDTMRIINKWLKLDEIADLYSLPRKTGNGLMAIKLFEENKLKELEEYCFSDVILTEKVYQTYIKLKNGDTKPKDI